MWNHMLETFYGQTIQEVCNDFLKADAPFCEEFLELAAHYRLKTLGDVIRRANYEQTMLRQAKTWKDITVGKAIVKDLLFMCAQVDKLAETQLAAV